MPVGGFPATEIGREWVECGFIPTLLLLDDSLVSTCERGRCGSRIRMEGWQYVATAAMAMAMAIETAVAIAVAIQCSR